MGNRPRRYGWGDDGKINDPSETGRMAWKNPGKPQPGRTQQMNHLLLLRRPNERNTIGNSF